MLLASQLVQILVQPAPAQHLAKRSVTPSLSCSHQTHLTLSHQSGQHSKLKGLAAGQEPASLVLPAGNAHSTAWKVQRPASRHPQALACHGFALQGGAAAEGDVDDNKFDEFMGNDAGGCGVQCSSRWRLRSAAYSAACLARACGALT